VTLDADACFLALRARDRRFDGTFYVGVTTTGVYCRPICPARTPGRDRCVFFTRAAEAERDGYRACFRCRPELAPGVAAIDSIPRLVRSAAAHIEAGFLNDRSVDDLAAALGVTSRHLRRAMETALGVSPVELAQARRLSAAKQLLQDTDLKIAEVAFASGFSSVRRFNTAFRARFGRPPTALRRDRTSASAGAISLRLDYRPPLELDRLLAFLRARAIEGVEEVGDDYYARTAIVGDRIGRISIAKERDRHSLRASISLSLAPKVVEICARLRALFDLDAQPDRIAAQLGGSIEASVRARPGLRVPGAFDGFEMGVRAIVGQQISVANAAVLLARFARRFGEALEDGALLFPRPSTVVRAGTDAVAELGMPRARAQTIVDLARAIDEGEVELSPASDPEETIRALEEIRGIGPWTSHYLAMRALKWPDAFVAGDLVLQRKLGVSSARDAEEKARAWSPWRAYAVMHAWESS
jgi:AraC family transcriptional regulator, regulatory protein of adaptative response / DNA-3-methyladenine glycosylase II